MDRSSPQRRRGSKKAEPKQARARASHERILESTVRLMRKQSFDGTPMSEIARHAGVGTGTLYRHFPDRRALLLELLDHWTDRKAVDRREDVRFEAFIREDPRAALAGFLRRMHGRMHDQTWFFASILPWAERDPEFAHRLQRLKHEGVERLAAIFEYGQQVGKLRNDSDPVIAAMLVIHAIELISAVKRVGVDSEAVLHEVTSMICRYLLDDR